MILISCCWNIQRYIWWSNREEYNTGICLFGFPAMQYKFYVADRIRYLIRLWIIIVHEHHTIWSIFPWWGTALNQQLVLIFWRSLRAVEVERLFWGILVSLFSGECLISASTVGCSISQHGMGGGLVPFIYFSATTILKDKKKTKSTDHAQIV